MSNTPGSAPTWLDPQHPANREQLLNTVATLAQLGVDGIHLDYIRYPEWVGETPTAATDAQRDDLTATVAAVAQQVRDINPAIRLSAAVFPTGGQQSSAVVDLIGLQQRRTDLVALRSEKGEAHPAAHQQSVDLRQQGIDHRQLVTDLAAAQHHHVGPVRALGEAPQHLDLGADEITAISRQQAGHLVHRRVLAVHRAERVVHVRAATVATAGGEADGGVAEIAGVAGGRGAAATIVPASRANTRSTSTGPLPGPAMPSFMAAA